MCAQGNLSSGTALKALQQMTGKHAGSDPGAQEVTALHTPSAEPVWLPASAQCFCAIYVLSFNSSRTLQGKPSLAPLLTEKYAVPAQTQTA